MEGRSDWGRYDFGTFRRRNVLTMGRFDCKAFTKLPLSMGGSRPPSNTWFLGPTRVLNPNGISIGAAVFAQTDRQTDRQTTLL